MAAFVALFAEISSKLLVSYSRCFLALRPYFFDVRKNADKFDYIMIETTGLADPAPIIQTFFTVPGNIQLINFVFSHP